MLRVGITGQQGFVGTHLFNTLGLNQKEFERVIFHKDFFNNNVLLDQFVSQCDVIVHLAAMNRHADPQVIYDTNINLVHQLIHSLERTKSKVHVIMSSSSQEEKDNLYGKSKKEGRELLSNWALNSGAVFTGLVIPNVFGPFGLPFYNSVVATFSHQLTNNEVPKIQVDGDLKLIYVDELVSAIITKIREKKQEPLVLLNHTAEAKVSEILSLLENYKSKYQDSGEIPVINNTTPNICITVGISFIKKIASTATISGVKFNHKLTVTAGRSESPIN